MISLIDFFYLEKIDVIVGWQFGFVSAVTFIQRAIARSSLRIQMCVYVCVCVIVCAPQKASRSILLQQLFLKSEFGEEPLVLARFVSTRERKNESIKNKNLKNPKKIKRVNDRNKASTNRSSNLVLTSFLAFRLPAGSLKDSLLSRFLSKLISTEYLNIKNERPLC